LQKDVQVQNGNPNGRRNPSESTQDGGEPKKGASPGTLGERKGDSVASYMPFAMALATNGVAAVGGAW
jgi:hypothetical protein